MVTVKTSGGRLGNQMFEYAFGRIIAEHFNYKFTHNLPAPELSNDFKLPNIIDGREILDPVQLVEGNYNYPPDLLDNILNTSYDRKIVCDGFFQNYNYYKNYKHKLKQWFHIDTEEYDSKNDLAVHIRKGDYKAHPHFDLPDEYFLNLIKQENFDRLIVSSDEPSSNVVQKIFEQYKDRAILFEDTPFNTLYHFACHNKLILSFGTFSWWIGFLSNAEKIYLPNKFFPGNIDLRITDDKRYTLI